MSQPGSTTRPITAGETFEAVRQVDPYRPIYYAAASGDFNPIHIDPAIGQLAGYQGVILQGMCTFAWLADACAAFVGDPAGVRRVSARFSRPVQVGDVVTFRGRCAAVEGGRVRLEVSATNQRGEEVLKGASAEAGPAEATASASDTPAPAPPAAAPQGGPGLPGLGRRYGPYRFAVGAEHLKDFAAATGGGVPGRVFPGRPELAHPWTFDEAAAAASPHGTLVAAPGFAAVFAIQPFSAACADPALEIDVLRLLHGGQELELSGVIRPGDVLTTTGEITRLEERGALDFLEVTTHTANQRGETVVRGVWTAVIRG